MNILTMLTGIFFIMGTFGAADVGRISLGAFIVQIVIGLFLTIIGWARSQAIYEEYPY